MRDCIESVMRVIAGELTLSDSAPCAFAAGTSAYTRLPSAATNTLVGVLGASDDCGGDVVPFFASPPPVILLMTWSAACSAAAAGKYTLMVTHAAISRLASAIFSGNTR